MKKFELHGEYQHNFDYKITLKPTDKCNQKCWFCNEYNNQSNDWTLSDTNKVIQKINDIIFNLKKQKPNYIIYIYFYGGEPTLFKYWEYMNKEILKIDADNNKRLMVIQTQTNLSLSYNRLSNFLHSFKNNEKNRIELCSSYHVGYQKVQEFKQKLDLLDKHNANTFCFFSTDHTQESLMLSDLDYLKNNSIIIRYTLHDKISRNYDYTKYSKHKLFIGKNEEQFNFDIITDNNIKSIINYKDVMFLRMNSFENMKCDCTKRNLIIDNNLLCYSCMDYQKKSMIGVSLDNYKISDYMICEIKECYNGLEFKKQI